jgi:HTH-type transcriptional regulator/antitoxin HigA
VSAGEAYEREHYPIDPPDPIDAILFRLEQMGLNRKALEPAIGSQIRVREALERKRPPTLPMIRRLNKMFGIPLDVLIQPTVKPRKTAKRTKSSDETRRILEEGAKRFGPSLRRLAKR